MSTTVAIVAKKAFDAAAVAFSDVIQSCTLTRPATDSTYNTSTGLYEGGTDAVSITGRALIDESKPINDIFPNLIIGPNDRLIYLEGLSQAPKEGDTLTIGSVSRTIGAVGDIVGVGSFYSVVAQ